MGSRVGCSQTVHRTREADSSGDGIAMGQASKGVARGEGNDLSKPSKRVFPIDPSKLDVGPRTQK